MKFIPKSVTRAQPKLSSVVIEHEGQEIEWHTPTYSRSKFLKYEDLFLDVNKYLTQLHPDTLEQLWETYSTILSHLETVDFSCIVKVVNPEMHKLLGLLDLGKLKHFCINHTNHWYPEELSDHYEGSTLENINYSKPDYTGLLYLTVVFHFLAPILGEFTSRWGKMAGTIYKEYICMGILSGTDLMSCPEMDKLRDYIKGVLGNFDAPLTVVYNGLGTEELPEWLLGQILVRRLTLTETNVPNISIISKIYNTIRAITQKISKRFTTTSKGLMVQESKIFNTEEDKTSILENFKIKQCISDAEPLVVMEYLKNHITPALRLRPNISVKLVESCVTRLVKRNNLDIRTWRVQIVARVMCPTLVPVGVLNTMDYATMLRCIGIVQAILFTDGFPELAQMLTAYGKDIPTNVIRGDGYGGQKRSWLSAENHEALNVIYPYYKYEGIKSISKPTKKNCIGIQWIETISKSTQDYDWFYNNPRELLGGNKNNTPFIIPVDIKNHLARFLIHTATGAIPCTNSPI